MPTVSCLNVVLETATHFYYFDVIFNKDCGNRPVNRSLEGRMQARHCLSTGVASDRRFLAMVAQVWGINHPDIASIKVTYALQDTVGVFQVQQC